MNLPRSSYYHKQAESEADAALAARIEQIAEEHEKYGYRRMTAQLHCKTFVREYFLPERSKTSRTFNPGG